MSRLVSCLLFTCALSAVAEPARDDGPTNAVTVRLGATAASPLGLVGLGGLASGLPVGGEAGLSYERAFGHLSMVLGLDASGSVSSAADTFTASVEPGLRWTFGAQRLTGPWLGVAVPVSVRRSSFLFAGADSAPVRQASTGLGVGVEALAGWSFRFESGLFAQVAAGPRLATSRLVASTPDSAPLTTLGLRTFVAVGAAF